MWEPSIFKKRNQDNPPKYAIANGFVIGHLPEILSFKDKNGEVHIRNINVERDLNDVVCSAISPVRPFGYIHAYTAESQK